MQAFWDESEGLIRPSHLFLSLYKYRNVIIAKLEAEVAYKDISSSRQVVRLIGTSSNQRIVLRKWGAASPLMGMG